MASQTLINAMVRESINDCLDWMEHDVVPSKMQPIYIFSLIKTMGNFAGFQLGDGDILKIFRSISHRILGMVNSYIDDRADQLKYCLIAIKELKDESAPAKMIRDERKEIEEISEELNDFKKVKIAIVELRKKNLKIKPRKKK